MTAFVSAAPSAWPILTRHPAPEPTHSLKTDCASPSQSHSDYTGFPVLGASVQRGSPAASLGSSQGTAISISPKPTFNKSRAGRKGGLRYQNPSQHKLAESLQTSFSANSCRYHRSPEQVCADYRRAQAIALRTVQTSMVIGAALVGKCAGFGPHPHAQTRALERLLEQQNPAHWLATLAKHNQLPPEEQVQQLAASRPELHSFLQQQQDLALCNVLPQANQRYMAALTDVQAYVDRMSAEQSQAEADVLQAALNTASAVATEAQPASAATSSLEATVDVPLSINSSEVETATAAIAAAADAELSEYLIQQLFTAEQSPDAATKSIATDMDSWEPLMGATESTATDTDSWEQMTCSSSMDSIVDSEPDAAMFLPAAPFTQLQLQMILAIAMHRNNCAYGIQAEADMIREFELSQHAQQAQHGQRGVYTWHKMGAPDNQPIGQYSSIAFELGCQIDRALCQSHSSVAIPVECKNRRERFSIKLPAHERVQVQAQLQLCNAERGMLVERLQYADGNAECREHEIRRDTKWWQRKVMPALRRFLVVFARMATQQEELDIYFQKRACGQHHEYVKKLVKQAVF